MSSISARIASTAALSVGLASCRDADLAGVVAVGLCDVTDHLVAVPATAAGTLAQLARAPSGDASEDGPAASTRRLWRSASAASTGGDPGP
jgi:hypothetical protein